jgi:hypothetical protein
MTKVIFNTLAVAVLVIGAAQAGEADGAKKRPTGPAGQAQILLKHADELALTAEQKAKLEDMAKGPMSVLTDDQKTKARAIILASRPEIPGARKPDAPAAKPAEGDKKEDKKPEGEKKEEPKKE